MPQTTVTAPIGQELEVAASTATGGSEEKVLQVFRLHGGEVNIDQIKEAAKIDYAQAMDILWRLQRRGEVVQAFYKTRYALSAS